VSRGTQHLRRTRRKSPSVPPSLTQCSHPRPSKLYHGGVPGLQAGDRILPVTATGTNPRNAGGPHRPDRVYVTDALETAALFAMDYDNDQRGTVYEVTTDGRLEDDPESLPWMRGYVTETATVVRDLGGVCVCGSGRIVDECCGEELLEQTRWARMNPDLVERLSACRMLAVLPYFIPVVMAASPVALRSEVHGPAHWEQVALNGLYVAAETYADIRIVLAFSLLHDAFRETDGHDPEHGHRAAEWAAQNADKLEGVVPLEELVYALHHHADGLTSENPTIEACWDADRLDLIRLGVVPTADLLSTEAGRLAAKKMTDASRAA
jgi:uncharacterized protein